MIATSVGVTTKATATKVDRHHAAHSRSGSNTLLSTHRIFMCDLINWDHTERTVNHYRRLMLSTSRMPMTSLRMKTFKS